MSDPRLSPSALHRALADATRPRLAFSGGDVTAWQAALRGALLERIGWSELPSPIEPPVAERVFLREYSFGSVEKIRFEAEPGADVLTHLALPRGGRGPYPLMICLQGHTSGMHNSLGLDADEQGEVEIEGGRDFGRQALARGWAALCIEQRSLGQRAEQLQTRVNEHNACHDAAMHALMLGRTLLAERVYDVARALDWAGGRRELDLSRVGITGNSGGGTVATWAAALLPSIGFVMPSCSLCTFRDSLMSIYHCADNYVPGVLKIAEMSDIAGLVAPRPFVAIAGAEDPIFPLAGVERCFAELRRVYAAHGRPHHAVLCVARGGHRFYPELAWPAAEALLAEVWGTPA